MVDKVTFTYRDYSEELASMTLRTVDLSAANFVAQLALRDALDLAMADLTLGIVSKVAVAVIDNESALIPASAVAQRELKWMCKYIGANGKTYNVEIPTPDLTDDTLLSGNTDDYDPTNADWIQFVTDFEALVVDEAGGAVTFVSARLSGRNT